MKFDIDISLIGMQSLLTKSIKANMFEELAKSLNIKFQKFYCDVSNRHERKLKNNKSWEDYTIIYEVDCSDCYYSFFIYLLNKRFKDIEILNEKMK